MRAIEKESVLKRERERKREEELPSSFRRSNSKAGLTVKCSVGHDRTDV